jgi:hypothetical protein
MGDDDDEGYGFARKARWLDLAMIPLAVLSDIADALADGVNLVCKAVIAHENYLTQRDEFANEIRAEIESLPQE